MKGIDVAKWNGVIDWQKAKADGVEFAILKAIDKQCNVEDAFNRNYAGATAAGIPIDVYNYSYATSIGKGVSDAKKIVSVIKGTSVKKVWLDVEDKVQMNLGMSLIDIIKAYQEVIEDAGYEFGVYTGLSFYNTHIRPFHTFLDCKFWIARYPSNAIVGLDFEPLAGKKPNIIHDLWGWQYTSKGRVDGISGNVDLNIRYDMESEPKKEESGIVEYSLAKDGNKYIAKNFQVEEFRCKDGTDKILIDVDFVRDKLQKIRDHFGRPVTFNSAYRTRTHNEKVGGASGSYHLKGQAFDIVVKGIAPAEVAKYAQQIGVPGIIQYNTFVHVDSRIAKYYARNNNGKVTKLNSFT